MEIHLLDNVTGPPTVNYPAAYHTGNRFGSVVDAVMVAIRWYKWDANPGNAPTRLSLWDVESGVQLYTTTTIPGAGDSSTGWKSHLLSPHITLEQDRIYCVSIYTGGSAGQAYSNQSGLGDAPAPLYHFPEGRYYQGSADPDIMPGTSDLGTVAWVDITVDTDGVPDGVNASPLDIENRLAAWLSADGDNSRTEHLPWLTKVVVDAIAATQITHTAAIAGVAPSVVGAGGPTLAALAAEVATATGVSLLVGEITTFLNTVFGGAADPDHAGITIDNIRQSQLLSVGVGNVPVGASGWTLQDQTTGTGSVLWVQPADAYTFTMESAVESLRFAQAVGAGTLHNWRAWAKPWDGVYYYPEHVQVNGPECVIRAGGRWPGIALWVPPDVEWTLKAWMYTGS